MWSSTFLDDSGRPSFTALQNLGSSEEAIFYYVFDVLMLAGRDVMSEPWSARRAVLRKHLLPKLRGEQKTFFQENFSLDAIRHGFMKFLRQHLVKPRVFADPFFMYPTK